MSNRPKYPWETWCDGQYHVIYRNEDYSISTFNMQISLHGRARTKGLKVSSRSFVDREPDEHGLMKLREGLVFQFHVAS